MEVFVVRTNPIEVEEHLGGHGTLASVREVPGSIPGTARFFVRSDIWTLEQMTDQRDHHPGSAAKRGLRE